MRYQVYEPDTLEFDFSGIVGTIGKGVVSAGKSLLTNVFTPQNIQTVVSGIVQKQIAAKQPSAPVVSAVPGIAPGVAPSPIYPSVSAPQPIIMTGGGGGMIPYSAPSAPSSEYPFGIHPAFLIAGAAILALAFRR